MLPLLPYDYGDIVFRSSSFAHQNHPHEAEKQACVHGILCGLRLR